MSAGLGYAAATAAFLALFAVALTAQVAGRAYRPSIYWLVVVATTTVGTTASDYADRTLGLGYGRTSAILLALVAAVLAAWRFKAGKISADRISARRDEIFYWLTIAVSNTLGTALGDFTADRAGLGLGFEKGALLFAALAACTALMHRARLLPGAVLFWAAYILTRPLGATLGDTLTKPHVQGGLALGRAGTTLAVTVALIALIMLAPALRRPAATSFAT